MVHILFFIASGITEENVYFMHVRKRSLRFSFSKRLKDGAFTQKKVTFTIRHVCDLKNAYEKCVYMCSITQQIRVLNMKTELKIISHASYIFCRILDRN
jgi:hypothetical protein